MPNRGPISQQELFEVFRTSLGSSYVQPFVDSGYGSGLEAFEALCQVHVRVDEATNRTLQSLFILPWSGQTAPPAMGGSPATLNLQIQRTGPTDYPITLAAGDVVYEEQTNDFGVSGAEPVLTGRTYTLLEDFTFLPGEAGPVSVPAIATEIGYGQGNPLPGVITVIDQVGAGFQNQKASVQDTIPQPRLVVTPIPDVVIPQHVGQYVQLTAGANAGAVRRVVGYSPATSAPSTGGTALLAPTLLLRLMSPGGIGGQFVPGEDVLQFDSSLPPPSVIAMGKVKRASPPGVPTNGPFYFVIERTSGTFQPTGGSIGPITGASSLATWIATDFLLLPDLTPENGTAAWRILSWGELGITVTNPESPTPGAMPILDALGAERLINRSPGEGDESYRQRVARLADNVSPNAIERIANRIWAPFGGSTCLREVGSTLLPGVYADGDPGSTDPNVAFAYDLDAITLIGPAPSTPFFMGETVTQIVGGVIASGRICTILLAVPVGSPVPVMTPGEVTISDIRGEFVTSQPIVGERSGAVYTPALLFGGLRPQDRFKLDLDYTEFRAFFLIGVPPSNFGEFGIAYDAGDHNAYDAYPALAFADGFPLTAAVLNQSLYNAVNLARAGGVGFDLYTEDKGCF